MSHQSSPLLEIKQLSVGFSRYKTALSQWDHRVIQDMDFSLHSGEVLAVVGSSGSGKSVLAHTLLGILPRNAFVTGQIFYRGALLSPGRQKQLRGREITLIPQSVSWLDPLMNIQKQVTGGSRDKEILRRQEQLFKRFDLADKTGQLYPFQLSGGMARRVLFSTAVLPNPQLVIADEPTPGLHPEQAKEALGLLQELAGEGKGVLLITHDIDLALTVADRIAVFYAGTVVEEASAADFASGPAALRHPYTKALWQALPQNGFCPLPGAQPSITSSLTGCSFAPRCPQKSDLCREKKPPVRPLRGGKVRCFHGT